MPPDTTRKSSIKGLCPSSSGPSASPSVVAPLQEPPQQTILVTPTHPPQPSHPGVPEYNLLLLGPAGAGKTAFIEALKKYADQFHGTLQQKRCPSPAMGLPHTLQSKVTTVATDLPNYQVSEIYHAPNDKREWLRPVDYKQILATLDKDAYDAQLDRVEYLQMKRANAFTDRVRFKVIDTPGISFTAPTVASRDGTPDDQGQCLHEQFVFEGLSKVDRIHGTLVVVPASEPVSSSTLSMIQKYMTILPELRGSVSVVHTHVSYKDLHPSCTGFAQTMTRQRVVLDEAILGVVGGGKSVMATKETMTTVPHFLMDCDIHLVPSIQKCMTQETMRKILIGTMGHDPVLVSKLRVPKTPAMVATEKGLLKQFKGMLGKIENQMSENDTVQSVTVDWIKAVEQEIRMTETELGRSKAILQSMDTSDLEPLDEWKMELPWNKNWLSFKSRGGRGIQTKIFTSSPCTLPPLPPSILDSPSTTPLTTTVTGATPLFDSIQVYTQNIKILRSEGGQGHTSWTLHFKRQSIFKDAILHTRLCTKRSTKYAQQILELKTRIPALIQHLEQKRNELTNLHLELERCHPTGSLLKEKKSRGERMLLWLKKKKVSIQVYVKLLEALVEDEERAVVLDWREGEKEVRVKVTLEEKVTAVYSGLLDLNPQR